MRTCNSRAIHVQKKEKVKSAMTGSAASCMTKAKKERDYGQEKRGPKTPFRRKRRSKKGMVERRRRG